jgi:predicted small lipoprotein YifL
MLGRKNQFRKRQFMKNNYSVHSNKIANRLLKSIAMACALMGVLSACGQRGSLYLPTAPEAAQRSSIVETLGAPSTPDTEKSNNSSTRAPMTPPASK